MKRLKHGFDWWLRQHITWSARVSKKLPASLEVALRLLEPEAAGRAAELMSAYACNNWHQMCTAEQIQINLYVLDVLDRIVGRRMVVTPSLDIGSAHWNYLPALAAFTGGQWHGVELDAYQRYIDLTTRRGHAEYMLEHYTGSRYQVSSVMDVHTSHDFITWLLPYVCIEPLQYAGLPEAFYQPEAMLLHVWERLLPGGVLLIINQGASEAASQQQLLQQSGIEASMTELTSVFSVFKKQRFVWRIEKPA